jgi:3-phosphoshikimate 1-carboxyvinyltransferase
VHHRDAVTPLRWTPQLPGDKSITHRAYLLGALAEGTTTVDRPNEGDDCRATLRAIESLGVLVERTEARVRLIGSAGRLHAPDAPLDLGNSGTGLRLLLGLLAGQPFTTVLTGDASLRRRPVERVLAPLRSMGARAEAAGDHPPVTLTGAALTGATHRLATPSAQAKSALLLAGVQASGRTRVEGIAGSRDHTERLLPAFGCPVATTPDAVTVEGPRALTASDVRVPGDPSAATFYLMAAALTPRYEVTLEGVSLNPTRIHHFEVLRRMGLALDAAVESGSEPEPWGRVTARGGELRAVEIGPSEIAGLIDELPALAVLAAFARGTTRVSGAAELRVKESDRLSAVAKGLAAIGAKVTALPDGWLIEGSAGAPLAGGAVETSGDHRVAMAFLIAGLATRKGVTLVGAPMIETSDPFFLSNLEALRS